MDETRPFPSSVELALQAEPKFIDFSHAALAEEDEAGGWRDVDVVLGVLGGYGKYMSILGCKSKFLWNVLYIYIYQWGFIAGNIIYLFTCSSHFNRL